MESRRHPAGRQYASAPSVRTSEPARALWRLLAGQNDEGSALQISVLTFRKTKGDRDMKKALLLIFALGIAGCSTTAVNSNTARQVPSERVLMKGSGDSVISITRDKGWFAGGGCFVEVIVDGKSYARIDTGETIDINVAPGRHILGISGDSKGKGLCAMQVGQPIKETSTQINSKEHQKFRITGDTNSGLDIRPTML